MGCGTGRDVYRAEMRAIRAARAVVLAAVVGLVLASCTGEDEAIPGRPAAAPADAPSAASAPVATTTPATARPRATAAPRPQATPRPPATATAPAPAPARATSPPTPATSPVPGPIGGSVASDRAALVALWEATHGANWRDGTNWLTDRPLGEWYGVRTDGSGRVAELRLSGNDLAGSLPPELGALAGLTRLEVGYNDLGGAVPAELGDLARLEVLDLAQNWRLSGPIPAELGRLVRLRVLNLMATGLSGQIPPELASLTSLEFLDVVAAEGLVGCLPAHLQQARVRGAPRPGLGFCPAGEPVPSEDRAALVALYEATGGAGWTTSANWLSERPIGEWYGVLTGSDGRVVELQLAENGLAGPLPPELGRLASLEVLVLASNRLTGAIPPELGGLASLTALHLGYNELSGRIPAELGDLASLRGLAAFHNELSGPIPPELGRLSRLESLHLAGNRLSGPIPTALARLGALRSLYLGDNDLSGTIPPEFAALESLTWLELGGNEWAGCIPGELEAIEGGDLGRLGMPYCGEGPGAAPGAERAALAALFEATSGDGWAASTNWMSDRPLGEWYGVATDPGGRVARLDLTQNGLIRPIPPGARRSGEPDVAGSQPQRAARGDPGGAERSRRAARAVAAPQPAERAERADPAGARRPPPPRNALSRRQPAERMRPERPGGGEPRRCRRARPPLLQVSGARAGPRARQEAESRRRGAGPPGRENRRAAS